MRHLLLFKFLLLQTVIYIYERYFYMWKAIFSTGGSSLEGFSSETEVKKAAIVKKRTTREENAQLQKKEAFILLSIKMLRCVKV